MKLNKTSTAVLLLVLIACNILVSNCEQIKKSDRKMRSSFKRSQKITRSYTTTKLHSKSKLFSEIFEKLKEAILDPVNILYFSFGVASEFYEDAEKIYKQVKEVIEFFKPCYETFQSIAKSAKEDKENEEKKQKQEIKEKAETEKLAKLIKFTDQLDLLSSSKKNKMEYCKKSKKDIMDNYDKALNEISSKKSLFTKFIEWTLKSTNEYDKKFLHVDVCYLPTSLKAPKTAKEITKNFANQAEYGKQCIYIWKLDCKVFEPETAGIWDFIKKAYSYYKFVKKAGTCIVNLASNLVSNSKLNDKQNNIVNGVKNLFKKDGFFYDALATTLGAVAHVFTLGAWGGIKGGYYLIELGLEIKKFYDDQTKDLAFRIGKLVGKGIKIAKSFLFGRRKLLRRMK